jgi:hypothetical protein
MDNAIRVRFEPLRALAFGSISGTYAAIGTALANASHLIKVDNLTDVTVTISFDGVNDHFVMPTQSGTIFDFSSDMVLPVGKLFLSQGTIVYVKQTSGAPSSGNVYVSSMYASVN